MIARLVDFLDRAVWRRSPNLAADALPDRAAARLDESIARSIALAGLAGGAHVAVVYRTTHVLGGFAWTSRDVVWMSPLSNALILACLATGLWLVSRVVPRVFRAATVDGVLAAFATLAMLLLVGGLHSGAVLALSLGVGVQFGRWSASSGGGRRVVRGTTVAGLVVMGVLVLAGVVERATRDRRATPATIRAAPAGAPNVLVIIWDTVRAASVTLYGAPRSTTPQLEKFATTATTFDWAIAPAPWTLPSHCSMFTGLQPGEHTCRWDDPLRGAPTTMAAEFAAAGWRTGAFVANHFYTTHETGLDRGFGHFADFQVTVLQLVLTSTLVQTAIGRDLFRGGTLADRTRALRQFKLRGDPKPLVDRKRGATVTDEFLRWQASSSEQPFFAFLNLFDAHDPYEPPPPWDHKFSSAPSRLDLYEGGIAYMDNELGRLTSELERRGALANTIIVVTSDHGEAFGEHSLTNHGHALYMPLVHVPLVIRAPARLTPGTRVAAPIALRDLAATMLDLAGLGPAAGIGGSSFATPERLVATAVDPGVSARRLALAETERTKAFWGRGPARDGAMHSLVDDSLHYIVDAKGREEVFAYRTDRAEAVNLALADSTRLARFRAQLTTVTRRLVQ